MKAKNISALEAIFYRGDYPVFLSETIDSADFATMGAGSSSQLFPLIIGALTFVGQLTEAEALYLRKKNEGSSQYSALAARFFLGVGFCRQSDYSRARKYIGENYRCIGSAPSMRDRFFIYQGLAFYRYFCGRFRNALEYGRRSLAAAVEAEFVYGKAFAYDLVGHCLAQTGDAHAGIENLEHALKLATRLGNGGLARGFQVSLACYRAQFMGSFVKSEQELGRLEKNAEFADSYSKASLLLELGRQLTLRGDLAVAKKALDRACLPIHSRRHRRYGALLGLRYSVLWSEAGEPHQALHLIRSSLGEIDSSVDLAIEIELRGMEERLLGELGEAPDPRRLERIRWLTRRTGKAVGMRILARENQLSFAESPVNAVAVAKDPLGDLMDRLSAKPDDAIEAILESGYFGLLRRAFAIPAHLSGASFNSACGGVLIYDHGKIRFHPGAPPQLILKLARQLSVAECSKENLVSRVWGYRYHPLRHDATIYKAISRLRELLEPGWIEATAAGYRLKPGIILSFARDSGAPKPREPAPLPAAGDGSSAIREELNWRQTHILKLMKSRDFIDTEHCQKLFNVSEATARRDLSQLVRASLLTRLGKGRAIKYIAKG